MTEMSSGNGREPHKEDPMSDLDINTKQSLGVWLSLLDGLREDPMSDLEIYSKQSLGVLISLLDGLTANGAANSMPQCQVGIKGPEQGVPQPAKGVGAMVEYRVEWLLTEASLKDVENLVESLLPDHQPPPQ